MGAKLQRVETDTGDPFADQARVLPGGEAARFATPTPRKQELTRLPCRQLQVVINRLAGLLGNLEPDWAAGLPLPNGCAVECVAVRCHVIHADANHVAAAQLAVDGKVEQARSRVRRSSCSLVLMDHTWLGLRGGLAPGNLPLFQGTRRDALSERGTSLSFMVCLHS